MISSVRSTCKEVAAIVPVKNITAEVLSKMILEVMRLLHKTLFKVSQVVADNNKINGNAFK